MKKSTNAALNKLKKEWVAVEMNDSFGLALLAIYELFCGFFLLFHIRSQDALHGQEP